MRLFSTWQFNLILYYVMLVTYFQCYKVAVRNTVRNGAATVLLQLIAGISVLALVPLFPFEVSHNLRPYMLLGVACAFYAINDRLQTPVRKHLEVSTYSIIGQLATIFLIIFSVIFFREPLTAYKVLGAALILGANVWLFYKPRQHRVKLDIYRLLAIGATLMFATAISIDIGISEKFNLPFYISLTLLIPAVFIAASERIKPREIAAEFNRGTGKFFVITAIAWGLAIFFSLRAFRFGEVNVIVPLQAVGVLLNVLAAYVFLGERSQTYKKLTAAVLVILGVLFTVV